MLLSFATLVAAMVLLVDRPIRERFALLLSIVPVPCSAISCGSWRRPGRPTSPVTAVEAAHDWAGLAMMPLALALLWFELRILSWVFIEVDA